MKKKDLTNKVKLKLNRETLKSLEQSDLTAIHGGATELNTCRPCNTRYVTCLC